MVGQNIELKSMPFLPGFAVPQHRDRHHKKATMGIVNGQRIDIVEGVTHERPKFVQVSKPTEQWRSGSLPDSTTRAVFKNSGSFAGAPAQATFNVPKWDALDRHVLRFNGYFKEAVVESNLENERTRHVIIYYYLEDDTCQVIEPKQDNAGIPQGQLIRRHRFPAPDGGYVAQPDLQIGGELHVYGKTLYLTDCDPFTRSYYEQAGMEQGMPEYPEPDNFMKTREDMKAGSATAPRSYEKIYREVMLGGGHINADMQQFLENDRRVLRFFAIMDDVSTPQFERRPFVILFFLADDQIELREMYPLNCGRDNFPIFFRKGKMPAGKYELVGPQSQQKSKDAYVNGRSFYVGKTVTMLGNFSFFIYDADEHSRQYFKEELGVVLDPRIEVALPERAVPRAQTPPYTGYGSWDDSLSSVTHLIPKQPRKDTKKLFEHSGKVLRFKARFADAKAEDSDRVFVVSFHLQDDCLAIHEPPQRNLGIVTGRYLEKGVHMNQITGALFKAEDMSPGSVIKVYSQEFEILDCDEYTEKLFSNPEAHFKEYDAETIMQKIRESMRQQFPLVRDVFRRFDKDHDGVITKAEFKEVLEKFGFSHMPDHMVMDLLKHFDTRQDGQVSYNEFCDVMLDEDYPTKMMHTKPPVHRAQDGSYHEKAHYRHSERNETQAVRKAVRQIGDIISKRENMVMKILKEFKHLTHEDTVNLKQVAQALENTGHPMLLEDVERAVLHAMPDVDLRAIPYVRLFQNFKTGFHDVSSTR